MNVAPGEVALVLEPGTDGDACSMALTKWPPDETAVLFVTFDDTPENRRDFWYEHADGPPRALAVVCAGSQAATVDPDALEDVWVSAVPHPSNLTRLGVELTRALEYLERESDGAQIIVCFRSISALLQYADSNQVFQFLQVLRDRFADVNAAAHAHLDTAAHDEQTIATLRWAFDDVIE